MKKPRHPVQNPQPEDCAMASDTSFYFIAGYTCGGATYEEVAKQERCGTGKVAITEYKK